MPPVPRRCAQSGCREWQPCPKHPTSNWKNSKSPPMPNNTKTLKKKVIARDGLRCRRCGTTKFLELDHIVPRARGGGDALTNLQLLCHDCHRTKTREDRLK